jgi:uncharacterized protein (TIGR03083 family)
VTGPPVLIDYGRLLNAIGVEIEVLLSAAEGSRPELPIPACPGLTLGETVRHVGSTYRMALTWMRTGQRPGSWQCRPVDEHGRFEYARSGAAALVAELAAHDPAETCATWWPADQTYGFWRRRMAHETAIHRMDVQEAVGREADPVDDDFALDGVDEVLTLWFIRRLAMLGVRGTRRCRVLIHCGGHRWLATVGGEENSTERVPVGERPTVDGVVSGTPLEMYRWLWGRLPQWVIQHDGDADAIAQVWALLRLATR